VARAEISADQFRRDFTINTLALALNGLQSGRVLDPWGGARDLNSRLIRVLHPLSFVDDPTRIFRALRLAGRLEFRIETSTLHHLQAALPKLKLLSGERLRTELELVLAEPHRIEILQSLQFFGALAQIDKHLRFFPKAAALLDKDNKPIPKSWGLDQVSPSQLGFVLWFMHLPAKVVDRIAATLRFDAALHAAVVGSSRLLAESDALRSLPPGRLVPRLEQEPLLSTYALFLLVRGTPLGKKLEKFARVWRHVQPLTDGHTLKTKGLRPGPPYTLILTRLRAARLDGKVRTAKQESALLEKLIHEHR
jgi:tRNA nucleotidyltransferase (CCA-adding enzyme)